MKFHWAKLAGMCIMWAHVSAPNHQAVQYYILNWVSRSSRARNATGQACSLFLERWRLSTVLAPLLVCANKTSFATLDVPGESRSAAPLTASENLWKEKKCNRRWKKKTEKKKAVLSDYQNHKQMLPCFTKTALGRVFLHAFWQCSIPNTRTHIFTHFFLYIPFVLRVMLAARLALSFSLWHTHTHTHTNAHTSNFRKLALASCLSIPLQ